MVEPIDAWEKDLREHLQPRRPPAGFTDRVTARAAARAERHFQWTPVWRWAMAALLLGAVVAGGVEHDRRQRLEGERAREQVVLALRITAATLDSVHRKISDNQTGNPDSGHAAGPGQEQ